MRKEAVENYLSHGKNARRTCIKLDYPSRTLHTEWILEDAPGENHHCRKSSSLVKCTQYEKEQAVLHMAKSSYCYHEIALNTPDKY